MKQVWIALAIVLLALCGRWIRGLDIGVHACGESLAAVRSTPEGPPVRLLADFEDGKIAPFAGSGPHVAEISREHATQGKFALRLQNGYAIWDGAQDWTGYDLFKADVFNANDTPTSLYIEIRDQATTDYWTRVNYQTVV